MDGSMSKREQVGQSGLTQVWSTVRGVAEPFFLVSFGTSAKMITTVPGTPGPSIDAAIALPQVGASDAGRGDGEPSTSPSYPAAN